MGAIQDAAREAAEIQANSLHVYGSKLRPFWAGCGGTVREYGGEMAGYRKGDDEYMEYIVTRGPMPAKLVTSWELDLVAIEEQ